MTTVIATGGQSRSRMQPGNDAMEQLRSRLEGHPNLGRSVALICCSFRQFHACETLHGRALAEELIEAGQRCLLEHSPEGTSLVRTGPGELALVIPLATDHPGELTALAQRLSHRCTVAPTPGAGGTPLLLTVAMGVARADAAPRPSSHTLITQARLAMHQACRRPGSQWVLASPRLQQQAEQLYRQQAELMQALQQGQFTAHLQPIVDLRHRRTLGFEALARWLTTDGRVLSPQHFLNEAQAAGLTAVLDLQVIAAGLRAAPRLAEARRSDQPLLLSMNISAQLIESDCRRRELLSLIDDHQPQDGIQLQLELVEEALADAETGLDDLLRELADRHVLIAIDDFGTGYSSLSRLHDLAINAIKVDRSFVQRINAPAKSSNQLLDTLVAVGHDLGITLTAEGVESEQQRCWLLEHGIEQGQGYLFSRPLSLDAAIASLSATS
jgi:EAL domain-containing protein (putative c-di-GMP-specific phosphodiesterase class I)/GGDEF domain-containing protein